MITNKNTTKKKNTYNIVAINAISENRGISKQYIRQCITGDRNSISADIIKKEYNDIVRKIEYLLSTPLL